MKRYSYLIIGLVAALALPVGCEKPQEQVEPAGPVSPFTLTATLEQPSDSEADPSTNLDPSTKTSLGSSNETKWSNGDKIKVFSGSSFGTNTVMSTTSTGTDAIFTKVPDGLNPDPVTTSAYYGFYPYTADVNPSIQTDASGTTITATLGNQTYVANSFGVNAVPMVAYNESGLSMAFKNVYGLLRLKIRGATGVNVSAIRVTSIAAGEYLSGKATVEYTNSGEPTVSFISSNPGEKNTSVTLTCNQAVALSPNEDKIFYIALPPTVSTTVYGYKVEIITSDGRMMTKTMPNSASYKIERSKILSMQSLTFTADPPMANSYIVAPNTSFTFNASYKGNSNALDNAINPKSVKVLWETGSTTGNVISTTEQISLSNGFVTLRTNNLGNAVVAVYDNTDPNATDAHILWSWHIWVTDYNPNTTYVTYPNSLPTANAIMMDRNLGALSNVYSADNVDDFGLLYQWGRKDPFRGSSVRNNPSENGDFATTTNTGTWGTESAANAVTQSGGSNALAYSIAHPMIFIYNRDTDNYCDWYCSNISNRNDNLWNSSKTIYDPCPAGWRVPYSGSVYNGSDWGVWNGWTNAYFPWDNGSKGRTYTYSSPAAWYPAAGILDNSTNPSKLTFVGQDGRYWSCSISSGSNFARNLIFDTDDTHLKVGESRRSYGFSVRCQKE